MNIEWLREYLMLCKTLNFHAAADALFISQSALSKHIAFIEKAFGVQLFVRDTKSVTLTEEGKLFKNSASIIINEYDNVFVQLNRLFYIKGSLKIAGAIRFPSLNEAIYPAISAFEEKYPYIKVAMKDIQWQDYREGLLKETYDVVFSLHLPNIDDEGLVFYDLMELPLCAWLQANNPFSGRETLDLEELADMKLRVLEEDKCAYYVSYLRKYFFSHGIKVKLGKPLSQMFSFSDSGFGITPKFEPSTYFGSNIEVFGINDCELVTLSMVRKRDVSNPIATVFYEELKSKLRIE